MSPKKATEKALEKASNSSTTSLEAEAIAALVAAFQAALPEANQPNSPMQVNVTPTRFKSAGLGQEITWIDEPPGYVQALQIEAMAIVLLTAKTREELLQRSAQIPQILLGTQRVQLRQQGVLSIAPQANNFTLPPAQELEQTLCFQVVFEFLKQATPSEGMIQTISVTTHLG
jgi:hypothetical protein